MISDEVMQEAMDAVNDAGHEYLTWDAVRRALEASLPELRLQVIDEIVGQGVRFLSEADLPALKDAK